VGKSQELIARFKSRLATAKTLLAAVKSAGRSAVNTGQCRAAFRDLEITMQFIKANCFNSPLRTSDEITALLLSLHNTDGHGMLIKLFAVPAVKRRLMSSL
jgi:hypothetical protein